MTQGNSPASYFAVFVVTVYSSFEEAVAKSPDLIQAHILNSKRLHAEGTMLMGGAFLDNGGGNESLSTMSIHTSYQAAQEFIENDPFVQNGMTITWRIRRWANMFA